MHLLTVEGVFPIGGRGVAVFGRMSDPDECAVLIGDEIEVRRSDGSTCDTRIIGIGIGSEGTSFLDLFLPLDIRDKVEIGDELWQKIERHPTGNGSSANEVAN